MLKILVAMSGGVDSSTTAVMLKKQGYEIIGVTMKLFDNQVEDSAGKKLCCTLQDTEDARKVAFQYNFSHFVSNMTEPFEEHVISYFTKKYSQGYTPNPCVNCNRMIKFGLLWQKAQAIGCDKMATGHYARIIYHDGKPYIAKAKDITKDQSYFLFGISPQILSHLLFPLGELTKQEVRKIAQSYGLHISNKPDSQDICFLKGQPYPEFVRDHIPNLPTQGPIVNVEGKFLRYHNGFFNYTVGQRKGLGIAFREPLYVIKIKPSENQVVVGTYEQACRKHFIAENPNIFDESCFDGQKVLEICPWYRCKSVTGTALLRNNHIYIHLHKPKPGISPGQCVVLYDQDRIVGGGWIIRED